MEHLLLLPLGGLIALVWVNTGPESYFGFTYAISFAVNDVAMVFFFALITKEVVEATAPDGVLHPWRRGLVPVIASIGATMVPAMIYVRVVDVLDEPILAIGWPVSFATDIAVSYFIARLIFGRHPAIPFLLLLAIASNILGFLALAIWHPTEDVRLGGALIMAVAIGIALGLRRARVRSFWPYLLAAGSVSWYALFWSGFHPALALVPIVPFLPHAARDPGFFVDARPTARDALSQFELWWKYPAQVALLFFGLVNAGVPLHALEAGTWGLPIAVIGGKPTRHPHRDSGRPRRRLAYATRGWLARPDCGGICVRNRFQYRAVLLHGTVPSRPAALGNRYGRATQLPRSATRFCGRKTPARRQIRTIVGSMTN